MNTDLRKLGIFIFFLLLIGGCTIAPTSYRGSYRASQQGCGDAGIEYEPTQGKVGHHMVVGRISYIYDQNCKNGRISDTVTGAECSRDLIVKGKLPPGLDFNSCYDMDISGTPTQPGIWVVTIRQPESTCDCGVVPVHDITTTFTIEGDAPRRIRR